VVHSLLVGLDDLRFVWLGDDGKSGFSWRYVLRDGHPAEKTEHVLVSLRGVFDQRLLRNLCVDRILDFTVCFNFRGFFLIIYEYALKQILQTV
jgi:hypothetical protein